MSDLELKVEKYYDGWVTKIEKDLGHNHTTTNEELDDLGKKYLGDSYGGCLPADVFVDKMLDFQDKNGTIYIVNDENRDENGGHWLTFIDDPEGLLAYDSYGQDIIDYNPLFEKISFEQDRKDREQRFLDEKNPEYNCGPRALSAGIVYKNLGKDCFLMI